MQATNQMILVWQLWCHSTLTTTVVGRTMSHTMARAKLQLLILSTGQTVAQLIVTTSAPSTHRRPNHNGLTMCNACGSTSTRSNVTKMVPAKSVPNFSTPCLACIPCVHSPLASMEKPFKGVLRVPALSSFRLPRTCVPTRRYCMASHQRMWMVSTSKKFQGGA